MLSTSTALWWHLVPCPTIKKPATFGRTAIFPSSRVARVGVRAKVSPLFEEEGHAGVQTLVA